MIKNEMSIKIIKYVKLKVSFCLLIPLIMMRTYADKNLANIYEK